MNTANHKALKETLKSVGRGLWFGILGLVVAALTAVATSGAITYEGVTVGGFTLNYSVIILAVVAYVIKLIDTYIHNNQNITSNGLAPTFLQNHTTPATVPAVDPVQPSAPAPGSVVAPQAPVAPKQTQIPVVDANEQPAGTPVAPDPSQLNS